MSDSVVERAARVINQECGPSVMLSSGLLLESAAFGRALIEALSAAGIYLTTHAIKATWEVGDRYTDSVKVICECGQELYGANRDHATELHRNHVEKARERQSST